MGHSLTKPVVAGNWKLNHGPAEARSFMESFSPAKGEGTLVLFPPYLSVAAVLEARGGRPVLVGVQDIYWEASGAFTGEISAELANQAGAEVALVGHSERRHIFGETDEETARKVTASLGAGLIAMLCVGEKIDEREAGQAKAVVQRQLDAVLGHLGTEHLDRFAVAYEPVWAIGTGKTATAADASEMHVHIRSILLQRLGDGAASVPILYGGSVKPANAAELMGAKEVDGVLVGGASLDPRSFSAIWDARG